jgi:Reverse transcriptase (RNA-dependent DNA polymerase)
VKRLLNRQVNRYKARVVARGFSQQYSLDYYETFAPVVRMESLCILLAIAAQEDLEIHQIDVITAYLAEELQKEIYIALPQSLSRATQKICRLKKRLYSLKQSARV